MRTLDADLTLAQQSDVRRPYITMTFSKGKGSATTYTYATDDVPNRIKFIRHSEEPYSHQAVVVLSNFDKSLPDLFGYYCEMSYGYVTEVGTPSSKTAPLWVKLQFHTSRMGSLDNILYLRGAWDFLADTADIGGLLGLPFPPYYEIDYGADPSNYTVYDIIEQVLKAAGFGLHPLGGEDDGIIDTLTPDFIISLVPGENAADVIYRLLNMTKVFCRAEQPAAAAEGGTGSGQIVSGNADQGLPTSNTRSGFYAVGRYWQWYSDDTNLVYKTSVDGSTWGSAITIATLVTGTKFALWYERAANRVHYIRRPGATGKVIYWRVGTPQTDGTISWIAAEQTVFTDVANPSYAGGYNVCTDSEGYAFVSYENFDDEKPYVVKNATHSSVGTWTDDWTQKLSDSTSPGVYAWYITLTPMTGGKVLATYVYGTSGGGPNMNSQLWTGSAWESEQTAVTTGASEDISLVGNSVAVGDDVLVAYCNRDASSYNKYSVVERNGTSGNWGTPVVMSQKGVAAGEGLSRPQLSVDPDIDLVYYFFGYPDRTGSGDKKIYYWKRVSGTWDAAATEFVDGSSTHFQADGVRTFYHIDSNRVCCSYSQGIAGPWTIDFKVITSAYGNTNSFRILYPSGYSSYDYTYTSDKPTATSHQFREFEWRDQPMLPNHVKVLANQDAAGTWDSLITGEYELAISNNNEYPDTLIYHVAGTLTSQADADNRAAAIALRMWMERQLGRVVVPHNCGQELYDWIKIRDNRGAESYTDYPPTRWGNEAVVGSLVHVYDPANAIYDLEITINGIESSMPKIPVYEFVEEPVEPIDYEEIPTPEDGAVKPPLTLRYPPTIPETLKIGPWNAALNMMTNSASFRRAIQSQIFRYFASIGIGPGAGGWAEGGIFGGVSPGAERISPEMWKAWPRDPSGVPLPISHEEAARLRESIAGEPPEDEDSLPPVGYKPSTHTWD